jgi:hypothetical protein
MRKLDKPSPTESPLLLEIDPEPAPETLTALGGMPLVVQTFRSLGLPASVKRQVHVKQRQHGYDEASFVESFVILNAAGGECLEDFDRLREDPGLAELIGHAIPSPEAARNFLHEFHDEAKIADAKQQLPLGQVAYIPGENEALQGLAQVNRDLIQVLGQRCPDQKIATVDQDATIIEGRKREAKPTCEGECGYQPMLAVWAEMGVVLADEFRDGNVPGLMEPLNAAKVAFSAVPQSVQTLYFRGDSACHEYRLVNWLRDEPREEGPQGCIGFAISARVSEGLHEALLEVLAEAWQPDGEDPEVMRECAEVAYVPSEKSEKKDQQPANFVRREPPARLRSWLGR